MPSGPSSAPRSTRYLLDGGLVARQVEDWFVDLLKVAIAREEPSSTAARVTD